MTRPLHRRPKGLASLLAVALTATATAVGSGCTDEPSAGTSINPTPTTVLRPTAPDEPKTNPPHTVDPAAPGSSTPKDAAKPAETKAGPPAKSTTEGGGSGEPVAADPAPLELKPVKYEAFLQWVAADKAPRLTIVDVWASWCGPCKENFPHLLAMHEKYAASGLRVASLSLDDPTKPKDLAEARKFLREKGAGQIVNLLLDEDFDAGVGFAKLNLNGIPAVLVFGPDGKELRRFTGDDPNNQFTYAQVEEAVKALLKAK